MAASQHPRTNGRRKSALDLAPLERDCMLALWPLGEGTVRQIRDELAAHLPRAYTTIMTIMDRLAHKGVVTRRKVGRAYLYQPNFSADEARAHAVRRLVEQFFDGSPEALRGYLAGRPAAVPRRTVPVTEHEPPAPPAPVPPHDQAPAPAPPRPTRLDETLL
jgi:predicted transcriptional regulator